MIYVPAINWNSLPSEKYIKIENGMNLSNGIAHLMDPIIPPSIRQNIWEALIPFRNTRAKLLRCVVTIHLSYWDVRSLIPDVRCKQCVSCFLPQFSEENVIYKLRSRTL